jgi:heme A synthase
LGHQCPEGRRREQLAAHRSWGFVLEGVAVVLLVLALIARQSVRTMIAALVLALLVVIAQSALASAGDSNKWIGGLHALDGMFILLLSVWMAVMAWRRIR